jgi:molecular chaperone HtpG
MKDGQKKIYFIAGENKESVENSVFLEGLRSKGYEVLYMIETIDEYMVQQLKTYKEYEFVSVAQEGLGLEDDDVDADETDGANGGDGTDGSDGGSKADAVDTKEVCKLFKDVLGSKVERVVVSKRIVDSPTCLVSSKQGWSANMERIMNAQAFGDNNMYQFMKSRKIMEINPDHKVIRSIYRKYQYFDDV